MYCHSCGEKIVDEGYKFCPKCGANLVKGISKSQSINTGNNSVNIGGNGDNHQYHIDNINYNVDNQQNYIKYNMDKIKKIPLDIKKASMFSGFVGLIGFIGSIASVVSLFKDFTALRSNSWIPYVTSLSMLLGFGSLYILGTLKKQGFKGVNTFLGDFLFLLDKEGKVSLIKAYSDCPECDGKINVIKLKNSERYIGVCNKNSEHAFSFDYTNFTGKPVAIQEFEFKIS
ncbi:MAG: zinc ribbon domain-containing protein [Anaeromicrobium sp.]|uniref:zinc ribbon domain-containing protein n=1 Tax=Anaeromicrobium sp. TaxID=1929132 RepID=UPI0025D7DD45|nr:zinc ribbon domain-containing protein [Anaeromicrobium sp.]MCT4594198.1 zinc ribbon domain-containing protein [Anaeromicrobium sp.]